MDCRCRCRHTLAVAVVAAIVNLLVVSYAFSDHHLRRIQHPANSADGSLTLMVVGDWGRKGKYNQSRLAYQMGAEAAKMELDFVISTGDNFYPNGLTDVDDPAFQKSFTNVYTASGLQKQWYAVLGNHDYRGDALAQLNPILTHKDSKWFCSKSFIVDTEIAEFYFIDTTPFHDKYFNDPGDHVYDWRGVLPREKYTSSLLRDLNVALMESEAKWKIVIGHHTIESVGDHGNTQELVQKLLPILKANDVDLYINGHDHCLEHIISSDSPLQFLTSGGGSKAWRGNYNWSNPNELKFYYDGQGFMTLKITQTQLDIHFYDIFGNVLHTWTTASTKSLINPL